MSTYQAKYRSGYFTFLPVRWAIGDPNARVSLPRLTEHPKQLWRTIDKIPTGSRVRSGVCFPNRMMKTVRVVGCLLDTDHRIDPFMWDINGNKLLHSTENVNMRLCYVCRVTLTWKDIFHSGKLQRLRRETRNFGFTFCLECPYQYISVNEDERGDGNPGSPGVKHLQKRILSGRMEAIPANTDVEETTNSGKWIPTDRKLYTTDGTRHLIGGRNVLLLINR